MEIRHGSAVEILHIFIEHLLRLLRLTDLEDQAFAREHTLSGRYLYKLTADPTQPEEEFSYGLLQIRCP